MKTPIRVAVTGAAGNIGYALLWRLASGDCFGADQPVILQMLEVTPALPKLHGTAMELEDSAFPLLHGIVSSDDPRVAFAGVHAAFLVGSRPRVAGMERADLVAANGPIFVGQGQALGAVADRNVKVVVVGNPCNTNAMIAQRNAKELDPSCFSAMTRLDQNRAVAQLATKCAVPAGAIADVAIWGNHSDTMFPDVSRATANGEKVVSKLEAAWLRGEFLQTVATRGKAIITARGASSAASAASAAVDHMRDWWHGTGDRIVSMAIPSQGAYGVPEGLMFSYPVRVKAGVPQIVEGWEVGDFAKAKIAANIEDLEKERVAVATLL